MGFTCAVQMTGLVRGEAKGKHRSNGKAILAEMGKERISSSDTLNTERTHLNVYEQENHSGFSMWDSIEDRANTYKQAVKGKTKSGEEITRYKSLRKDAVIGVAVIINPPYEECWDWSEEEYQKFYEDTKDCLAEFKPEIFRRSNQVFGVEHRDEGYDDNDKHAHAVYDAINEDGRYCGNELDAKFLSDFNKVYPEMMRSRGWEMDDLDTTDWDKYKNDSAYKEERDTKRRTQGKSVNRHMKNKTAENFKKSEEILEEAQKVQEDVEEQRKELSKNQAMIAEQVRVFNKNKPIVERQKAQKGALEADIQVLETRKGKIQAEVDSTLSEAEQTAQTVREEAKRIADAIIERAKQKARQALETEREELEKWQAEKEKDFQVREDALDAQRRAFEGWKQEAEDFQKAVNDAISRQYSTKYDTAMKQYNEVCDRKRLQDFNKLIETMAYSKMTYKGAPILEYFKKMAGVDFASPVTAPPVLTIPKVQRFRLPEDPTSRKDKQNSDDFEF